MPTLAAVTEASGLAVRLRNWSAGYPPMSAGVELLIAHDYWLSQPGFVNACVDVFEALDHIDGLTPMAIVLWDRVPGFLFDEECSGFLFDRHCAPGRARRVLRLAAELCGADTATPLADLVVNLGDDTTALVLDAIAHHADWDQRHHAHTVTGRPARANVTRLTARGTAQVELTDRLRAWSGVCRQDDPAVELLIAHDVWLTRNDFVTDCVRQFRDCDPAGEGVAMADIVWDLVPRFLTWPDVHPTPGSSAVLALAAELAGADTATPLAELFADLDETDIALVLDAVARIAGWHDRHHTHTVTGRIDNRDRR
jgi:hypothetical protein